MDKLNNMLVTTVEKYGNKIGHVAEKCGLILVDHITNSDTGDKLNEMATKMADMIAAPALLFVNAVDACVKKPKDCPKDRQGNGNNGKTLTQEDTLDNT
jgi:hypothetical protein